MIYKIFWFVPSAIMVVLGSFFYALLTLGQLGSALTDDYFAFIYGPYEEEDLEDNE